jgi:hypothetical protein
MTMAHFVASLDSWLENQTSQGMQAQPQLDKTFVHNPPG